MKLLHHHNSFCWPLKKSQFISHFSENAAKFWRGKESLSLYQDTVVSSDHYHKDWIALAGCRRLSSSFTNSWHLLSLDWFPATVQQAVCYYNRHQGHTTTTTAIISSSSCPSFQSCYRINCLLGNLSSEAQALLCRNLNPFPYQQSHTLTQALSSVIKLSVTLQIEFASQQYHHHHFHQLFNCTGGLHFPFSGPFLLQLLLNFFIR